MFEKTVYFITFAAWAASITAIATIGADFATQAPLCMVSTMSIFTLATLALKWKEKNSKKQNNTA